MRNDNQPKDDNYAYEAFTDEFKRRFDQLPDKQIHELLDLVRSKIMEAYLQSIRDATADVVLGDEANQREISDYNGDYKVLADKLTHQCDQFPDEEIHELLDWVWGNVAEAYRRGRNDVLAGNE